MTIQHSALTGTDLHEPKGVAGAAAGQVYVANGSGSGTWQSQAAFASNTVIVESASDFPAAVAGVRTLAASTIYLLAGFIDIGSDRLVAAEDSIIIGTHRELSGITSTTTSNLITATSVDLRLQGFTIDAASAAQLVSFDGATKTKILTMRDMRSTTHTGKVAVINNASAVVLEYSVYVGGTDLFEFTGAASGTLVVDTIQCMSFTGAGFKFGSTVLDGGRIFGSVFSGTGGADVGISGLALNGNLAATYLFYVDSSDFNGTTAPLSGITDDDTQYIFSNNRSIDDTQREAHGYIQGNATTTTIASTSTPVKTDVGTGFSADTEKQFTVANDGRVTYNGVKNIDARVWFSVQGTGASGTNTFKFYIAKNGTVDVSSGLGRDFTSTANGVITSFGILNLVEGDYLEVWVENTTATTDFNVIDLNIMVSE